MQLKKYLCLVFALSALLIAQARAQYSIFLETDGPPIKGDSNALGFEDAWVLSSFSHGVSLPIEGAGNNRSVGQSQFTDVGVAKFLDRASVLALLKAADGTPIEQVTISFAETSPKRYTFYKIVLENVLISSISQGGSTGATKVSESLSLNFTKITWSYFPQKPDGTPDAPITGSWDLTNGTP